MAQLPSAADVAQNWVRGMQGSSEKARHAVNRVSESPTAKAATQEATQKYLTGVQDSVSSGRRQRALNAVSTQEWKDAMIGKGIPRMASGATASQQKFQGKIADVLAFESQLMDRVNAMPNGTLEDRIAKSAMWQREMAKYRQSA